MISVEYTAKIDLLYKYIAEGWPVILSENKAGLTHDATYKRSEHYMRVRKIAGGRSKRPAQAARAVGLQ